MKPSARQVVIALSLVILSVVGFGSLFYTMMRFKQHPEFLDDYNADVKRIEKAQGQIITLTETQNGNRKWVLKIKEIHYSKNKDDARLTGVQGLVYDDDESVLFTFSSPKGLYNKTNSRVTLEDGARMVSPTAKIVIEAPRVQWSSATQTIDATGGVRMSKENFGQSQAEKALIAMDFSKIQFSGGARSILGATPPKAGALTP